MLAPALNDSSQLRMKKLGFKIYINSEPIKVTGIDVDGSMGFYLNLRNKPDNEEQDIKIDSVAYLKNEDLFYKWIVNHDVDENDEITIKIISDEDFDDPVEVLPRDNPESKEFALKSKLKTYYKLKEELKDHIKE